MRGIRTRTRTFRRKLYFLTIDTKGNLCNWLCQISYIYILGDVMAPMDL